MSDNSLKKNNSLVCLEISVGVSWAFRETIVNLID